MMGSTALVCKPIDTKEVMAMKSKMDEPSWLKMLNSLQVGIGAGS
jgi:hypothetical protein